MLRIKAIIINGADDYCEDSFEYLEFMNEDEFNEWLKEEGKYYDKIEVINE